MVDLGGGRGGSGFVKGNRIERDHRDFRRNSPRESTKCYTCGKLGHRAFERRLRSDRELDSSPI